MSTQPSEPQSTDVLSYIRVTETTKELVRLVDGVKQSYVLQIDSCWAFSPSGEYFAESSFDRSDLIIRHVSSMNIIYQGAFQEAWKTCSMGWQPDDTLSIDSNDNQSQFLYFALDGNTLTLTLYEPTYPQYPELDDWLQNTGDGFILASPNPSIYLYERCEGRQTTRSGNSCAVDTDFVIYDAHTQQIKQVLQGVNKSLISQSFSPPFESAGAAVWSERGRYLAYSNQRRTPFNLSVYDVETGEYLDTKFRAVEIDWQKKLQWSPVGDRLAIWLLSSLNETDPLNYRTLAFFDANTQQFVLIDHAFDVSQRRGELGYWSPDGKQFVFGDINGKLFLTDSLSGTSSLLDSDVGRIIGWKLR